MKKSIAIAFSAAFIASVFSCATFSETSSTPAGRPGLSDIMRPRHAPSAGNKTTALPLPKLQITRQEALKDLRADAVRLRDRLRAWLRAEKLARTNKGQPIPAVNADPLSSPPVKTRPRITMVDPVVRPIVNTPTADSSADIVPGRARTIYARQGDDIEISFKESGWILLERPPEGSGLEYVDRDPKGGKTLFKFRGQRIGTYALPFQYQDAARGVMKREIIEIKVVGQKEFDTAMGGRESDTDKVDKAKRRAVAATYFELGNFKEALREYLASYSEGDPALNHLIASLALREKDYKNAVSFWNKNLEEKGDFHDKAMVGLVRAFLGLKDRNALLVLARDIKRLQGQSMEEEWGLLIAFLSDVKEESLALDLMQEYLVRFPQGGRLAEIYYRLGRLHEFSKDFRDFKKARGFYQIVVKEYPESVYYAPAKERVDFINRHYFRVQ